MAKHRTDQEWASILSAFHRSGLSQAAFCRRRGLALSTFRLRLAAEGRSRGPDSGRGGSPAALVEIPLSGGLSDGAKLPAVSALGTLPRSVPVELSFPGGVRASMAVPADSLPGLLAVLNRLPRP